MKKLIAKRAVLYQGRMYNHGETLPAHDGRMVKAWLDAESAEWTGEDQDPEMVTGNLNAKELSKMRVDELKRLASKMGVDVSEAKNKAEIINVLLAVDVQGSAQQAEEDKAPQDMATGKLDPMELSEMEQEDLEQLAADMGVDISEAKHKADVIDLLVAAAIQVLTSEDDGGAQ